MKNPRSKNDLRDDVEGGPSIAGVHLLLLPRDLPLVDLRVAGGGLRCISRHRIWCKTGTHLLKFNSNQAIPFSFTYIHFSIINGIYFQGRWAYNQLV